MNGRTRPPADTPVRQAILEATTRIIDRDGILGLTVDRIVQRAGVSKGSFFYHFASKEQMMSVLLRQRCEEINGKIQSMVASGIDLPTAWIDAVLEEMKSNGPLMRAFVASVAIDPELSSFINDQNQSWTTRLVESGMLPGQAELLHRSLDGLVLSMLLSPHGAVSEPSPALLAELRRLADVRRTQPSSFQRAVA